MQTERMNLPVRARLGAAVSLVFVILLGGIIWTAQEAPPRWLFQTNIFRASRPGARSYIVSQKGRAFHPSKLIIKRGDTIEIVNDDGDLLHHAYVESNTFNFDSGDQLPGSKTDIVFYVRGTFNVLCGIHPKMKLVVEVK